MTPGGSAPSEPEADVVACSLTTTCLVDGALAGCALVRAGSPHRFGEFFVVRKYRRSGVGATAPPRLFPLARSGTATAIK